MARGNIRFPAVSQVQDESRTRPFKNGSGSSLSQGDVQAWKIVTTGRVETEDPSSSNIAAIAGVVAGATAEGVAVGNNGYGHLYTHGRVQVLVEGTVAITAGDILKAVAGQKYLVKDASTSTPLNGRPQFIAMESYSTASTALKWVQVDCPD